MNIQLEIDKIKNELNELQDENLIQTIQNILIYARKKTYESGLKPFSVEAYKKRAESSEKDIAEGRITDIDDLEKESQGW